MTQNYREEFPDYSPADLPTPIPNGFVDRSWHNDVCPSFHHESLALTVWADFADPETRELPCERYSLSSEGDFNEEVFFNSDDWNEILTVIAFAAAGFWHEARPIHQLLKLAKAARPINDDDWGSERQINAQNYFFEVVETKLPADVFEYLEEYCMKANVDEMIDKALQLILNNQ